MKINNITIFIFGTLLAIKSQSQPNDTTFKAQFIVLEGSINEVDYTEELLENNVRTEFYQLEGDTNIYMENIWAAKGSRSYGAISNLQISMEDRGDSLGKVETYTFTWHFYNSFDLTTGLIECEFIKHFISGEIYSRLVLTLDEGFTIYYGYLNRKAGYGFSKDAINYYLAISTDSMEVKSKPSFVLGTVKAASDELTFSLDSVIGNACEIGLMQHSFGYRISTWNCDTFPSKMDVAYRFVNYDVRRERYGAFMIFRDNLNEEFIFLRILTQPKTHEEIGNRDKLFRPFYVGESDFDF